VSAARPPEGARAPSGGSDPHAVGERGGSKSATLLDVRGLRAGYGAVEVLRGIDLNVGEGEAVALLGQQRRGQEHAQ